MAPSPSLSCFPSPVPHHPASGSALPRFKNLRYHPQVVTGIQAGGYVISLLGFAWYNQIKMSQIAAAATPEGYAPPKTTYEKDGSS